MGPSISRRGLKQIRIVLKPCAKNVTAVDNGQTQIELR